MQRRWMQEFSQRKKEHTATYQREWECHLRRQKSEKAENVRNGTKRVDFQKCHDDNNNRSALLNIGLDIEGT